VEVIADIPQQQQFKVLNFATSADLIVTGTIFPHYSIYKYIWTYPNMKTQSD
jgi:hypothetical protein